MGEIPRGFVIDFPPNRFFFFLSFLFFLSFVLTLLSSGMLLFGINMYPFRFQISTTPTPTPTPTPTSLPRRHKNYEEYEYWGVEKKNKEGEEGEGGEERRSLDLHLLKEGKLGEGGGRWGEGGGREREKVVDLCGFVEG